MGNNHHRGMTEDAKLRLLAEERLRSGIAETCPSAAGDDTMRLYHELQVHQVELELQNSELSQARNELETALGKYTDLYDFAPVGFFTLDCNAIIKSVNLAGASLICGVRSKLIGQRFGLLVAASDRPTFTEFLSKVLVCKIKETCEVALLNKKNQPVIVQIEATASASGHEFRLALINITGRRQSENALHESEKQMYRLAEMAVDGIIMLSDSGAVTFCNTAAERMFGCSAAEMYDRYFHRTIISKHLLEAVNSAIVHSREHGTEPAIGTATDITALRKDGTEFSLELSISAMELNGKWHAIGIMRDITERKLLETEIKDAREYAENIVETVREPLVVLNANLKILTANLSFYETFKVTPEETIGNFIYDLGNRQWDIPKLRVLFEEILHYQSVFNGYEVEHDFIEIGRKIILLNARQIFRKNIGSHIILLAMEDITERKQLAEDLQKAHNKLKLILDERTRELTSANVQQQETSASNRRLEEVSQTKSDFLANMSHELRTPLNSVIGFSEVLQDQMFGPINEKQQEYVTNILTSGKHLLSLINDILDLSKVESGKMELELSAFSLRETIETSLIMLKEKAQKGGVELQMELAPEVDERIVADQRKLKQILFNLVSNAVKFTPPDGTVKVSAVKSAEFIEVTVTDTGMGIRKDDIPKLFQAFTQLESVYTKEYEGTGLGLALTGQLVQLLGGTIRAESEFGAGSSFSFTIPLRNTTGIT
jgi:two-component system CheB/CheR fusion protein